MMMLRLGVYMDYAEPFGDCLSGVGNTAVKAWKDLLLTLQKANMI